MNRAQNRSLAEAEAYMESLIKLYIKFKNNNSHTENGKVIVSKSVEEFRLQLETMWKLYCNKNNNSSKSVLFLHENAFMLKYQENLKIHKKTAWFARVLDICKHKYGFNPPFNQVFEAYEVLSDPEDGAIYCVKQIETTHAHI